jgi:hypothetical protein
LPSEVAASSAPLEPSGRRLKAEKIRRLLKAPEPVLRTLRPAVPTIILLARKGYAISDDRVKSHSERVTV